jgi:hypothetical protein
MDNSFELSPSEYRKLLDTVDIMDQHKGADVIEVYDRYGRLLYRADFAVAHQKGAARKAVETERARKLNRREALQYVDSWNQVFYFLEARHAAPSEIAMAKALAEGFIAGLNA